MDLRAGKVYSTISYKRKKNKKSHETTRPKFSFSAIVAGFLISTTMLSSGVTTPAFAADTTISKTMQTQTQTQTSIPTDILGTTSYEYSQFKALVDKGVLDVELLKALNEGLNDMMASVAQGTLDTCSADFINLISDATVCFDKTDFNGLTVENNDNDDKDFYITDTKDYLNRFVYAISYKDVKDTDWFCRDVQSATGHGLINGIGDSKFNPQGTLTIAEAIKLAATANAYYSNDLNSLSVSDSGHWVSNYLSYARNKGIVTTEYQDLDRAISRGQMAELFARALPASEYAKINDFSLAKEQNVSEAVKTLYVAGIMIGDDTGSFRVNDTITRAETAAIINRVIIPSERVTVTENTALDGIRYYNKDISSCYVSDPTKRKTYNPKTVYVQLPDDNFQYIYTTPRDGYEKINVLYNHTYNSSNQAEYDAVISVVEEAYEYVMRNCEYGKITQAFLDGDISVDEMVLKYGKYGNIVKSQSSFELQCDFLTAYSIHSQIYQYLKKNYIMPIDKVSNTGRSAYSDLFTSDSATCEGNAHLSMAIWDVMGFNTANYLSPKTNHGEAAVEFNGQWYVDNWWQMETPEVIKQEARYSDFMIGVPASTSEKVHWTQL